MKEIYILYYTISIGFITTGLALRFGGEQFMTYLYQNKENDLPDTIWTEIIKYGGVATYVFGWIIASICLMLQHSGNKILKHSIFSAVIISVIWAICEFKAENFTIQPKLPLISCSILLSSLISLIFLKHNIKNIALICIAAILIIAAEFFILPFQRLYNIQDGIGLPVYILGLFLFFYVFSAPEISQNQQPQDSWTPLVDIKSTRV